MAVDMKIRRAAKGISTILVFAAGSALVLWAAARPNPSSGETAPPPADLSGYALPLKSTPSKIDSPLRRLIQTETAAVRTVVEIRDDGRRLPSPDDTRFFVRRIEELGGTVERTSGRLIQALLPPESIAFLAMSPGISRLRLPSLPQPAAVLSEGVARSGAYSWFDLPSYRSTANPVKIAVLDLGFSGYAALIGGELPAGIIVRSFRADEDPEAGLVHGTACAEIVHDMAPDALLYLVNFQTDVELGAAVDYLIAENVDVISCSLVWPGAGAGDGTGPICEIVKRCAARGILWVNAAGDDALSHWQADFTDANNDSFQDFASGDEILQWAVAAGGETRAVLTWDDWGEWNGSSYDAPTRDFDLLLWRWTGAAWELLEFCDDWQTGEAGQKPLEQTSLWKTGKATYYGISILKWKAAGAPRLRLIVQGNAEAVEYAVPGGSLGIPADAPGAVAVGATDFETDVLQTWSSRGPTADGRIKPDLTAFSRISTAVLGPRAFSGTSAAAPHVAGALGLLMAKTPFAPGQLRTILEERAKDLGEIGPDNLFGRGRLNLYKKTGS